MEENEINCTSRIQLTSRFNGMHAVKFINSNSKSSVGPVQKIVSVAEVAEKGLCAQLVAACRVDQEDERY